MKKQTFQDQVQEVYKHAHVSLDNKHYCKECFCCACVDYLNESKPKFTSMADVKQANSNIGHCWFDKESMQFFGTKLESSIYKKRLFVTSEKPPHGKRAYSIRVINKDGSIHTLGEVCQYSKKQDVIEIAKEYVKGLK